MPSLKAEQRQPGFRMDLRGDAEMFYSRCFLWHKGSGGVEFAAGDAHRGNVRGGGRGFAEEQSDLTERLVTLIRLDGGREVISSNYTQTITAYARY